MRWEYQSVHVATDEFDDTINAFGKVAWELVSVIQAPKSGPFADDRKIGKNQTMVVAFLKRPLD